MPDARAADPGLPLAEALRQLPLEAPDHSAWPLLARRLAAAPPKPRPRWPFALAAAALLALAALLPGRLAPPPGPTPAARRDRARTSAPRIAIEAGSPFGWTRYVASEADVVAMRGFGASAPAGDLYRHFGITADALVALAEQKLGRAGTG